MSRERSHSVITTQKKDIFFLNVYERNYIVVACHGIIPYSALKGDLKRKLTLVSLCPPECFSC